MLGGLILLPIGLWTVTHPNGGYRAAGGLGSSFSPGARRVAGVLLIAVACVLVVTAAAGPS